MASIKERVSKTGQRFYQVQIRRRGYPPASKSFETLQEARDWAVLHESAVLKNENTNQQEARKWTIPEVIDWYISNPNPDRKLETKKHLQRLNFLKVEFQHFTLISLTPNLFSKWIKKRLEINSPSTVYHYYIALKNALIHHSVIFNYSQSLFELVKCKAGSNHRTRRFSEEETKTLFRSINSTSKTKQKEMKLTVLFALETGCRIGEMLKLKWSEVNTKNRYIDFLDHTTKTKAFRRVPITSTAKNILEYFHKHQKPKSSDRVFNCWHLNEHHLSRQFKICCDRAKLEDIRWHDLRHEATSRFFEKTQLTDMEIALITGHKNLNQLKRYAHLRPSTIIHKLW